MLTFALNFISGESSAGKSSMLNLILGEELLPFSVLSTTSTICELRYGKKKENKGTLQARRKRTGDKRARRVVFLHRSNIHIRSRQVGKFARESSTIQKSGIILAS